MFPVRGSCQRALDELVSVEDALDKSGYLNEEGWVQGIRSIAAVATLVKPVYTAINRMTC